jgi:hypothetical protein
VCWGFGTDTFKPMRGYTEPRGAQTVIKWRKKKTSDVCSANNCKGEDLTPIPAGTYHKDPVYLCPNHLEKAKREIRYVSGVGPVSGEPTPPEPKPADPEFSMVPAGTQAELQTEAAEAQDALEMIREFEINDQEDYDFANEALGDAKRAWKDLEAKKKEVTKPLNMVLKTIRSWFKPAQDHYLEAEKILKAKLAEAHRKAAEEQDRALAEAKQAHDHGDAGGVRKAMLQAANVEIQQADNVTIMDRWCFEVTDARKLPIEYLCPDMVAIQETVKLLKDETRIPGVRVYKEQTVIRRGA